MSALFHDLNDVLRESGVLTESELRAAADNAAEAGVSAAEAAIAIGLVSEDQLYYLAADTWQIEYVFPDAGVDPGLLARFSSAELQDLLALPLHQDESGEIVVAFPEVPHAEVLRQLEESTDCAIRPVLASKRRLKDTHERIFGAGKVEAVDASARDSSGVTLFFHHVTEAFCGGALELRFEPHADGLHVFQRDLSGLHLCRIEPSGLAFPVAERARMLAQLPSDRNGVLDGSLELNLDQRPHRLRVTLVPTEHGHSVILAKGGEAFDLPTELHRFGLSESEVGTLRSLVRETRNSGRERVLSIVSKQRAMRTAFVRSLVMPMKGSLVLACVGVAAGDGWKTLPDQSTAKAYRSDVVYLEGASSFHELAAPGRLLICGSDAAEIGSSPFARAITEGVVTVRALRRLCDACSRPDDAVQETLRRSGTPPIPLRGARLPVGCERCGGTGLRGTVFLGQFRRLEEEGLRESWESEPWALVRRGSVSVQEALRAL